MSLVKKAIVYLSVAALAAPIVASGGVGVVNAAVTGGAHEQATKTTKPNLRLKVPFRDANDIFNLHIDKQKGGYVLVTNIATSDNNVIQKGEQLVLHFDPKNIDLTDSAVVNQDGKLPYTVQKDVDHSTVTLTFDQDVDSGDFETAIGLATKNIYTTSSVKADFEGANVKIANNQIISKWHQGQTQQATTSSPTYQKQSNLASGENQQQTTTRTVTRSTKTVSTTTTSRTYQTSTQKQTQSQTRQSYTPTYGEAEKAIMGRTNISISGTGSQANTQTSANLTNDQPNISANKQQKTLATTNSTPSKKVYSGFTNSTVETKPQKSAVQSSTDSTQAATTADATNGAADQSNQPQTNAGQTQASSQAQTNATVEMTVPIYANSSSVVDVQTPNGTPSDPKKTLDQTLQEQQNNPQKSDQTYHDNATFEDTKKDIVNKIPSATADEQAQVVKTMPWIWNYIANTGNQNKIFRFNTLLSTGRVAQTNVNAIADSNSDNILQQNMPKLLKAFGENLSANAFDKPMDIDFLLDSQLYQDYLAGKYVPANQTMNANDAWKAMNGRISVQKGKFVKWC